jgi:hypothetical protein
MHLDHVHIIHERSSALLRRYGILENILESNEIVSGRIISRSTGIVLGDIGIVVYVNVFNKWN